MNWRKRLYIPTANFVAVYLNEHEELANVVQYRELQLKAP